MPLPAAQDLERHIPVLLILGPTAGGKTDLALAIACRLSHPSLDSSLPIECITADSMQVYRHMDIGTAKPSQIQRARVPHHLLDLLSPSDDGFTVDAWLELALAKINEIRVKNRIPVIVGGTNLYVQALLYGLMDGPDPDPALRKQLETMDLHQLRDWLERVDPLAAVRIHRNDRKRTVRAIEVFELSGKTISEAQTQWNSGVTGSHPTLENLLIIGLDYPVEHINRRINARVKQMMDDGFLQEVQALLSLEGGLGRQAREALGYKQILAYLRGETSLEDAVEGIKIRTRRFAKQQRNWLKRFTAREDSVWIRVADGGEAEWERVVNTVVGEVLKRFEGRGGGG